MFMRTFLNHPGNAIEVLKQLQNKVDCVITSPAYYQQRIYGTSSSELGREPSVAEYISDLVAVFKAIPLEPWASSIWSTSGTSERRMGVFSASPHGSASPCVMPISHNR
jgi:DNA modification methylase